MGEGEDQPLLEPANNRHQHSDIKVPPDEEKDLVVVHKLEGRKRQPLPDSSKIRHSHSDKGKASEFSSVQPFKGKKKAD